MNAPTQAAHLAPVVQARPVPQAFIDALKARRETTQPIREKTGGNPFFMRQFLQKLGFSSQPAQNEAGEGEAGLAAAGGEGSGEGEVEFFSEVQAASRTSVAMVRNFAPIWKNGR